MTTDEGSTADAARAGLEHLQSAAVEMIAAARSMLDAVEELIDDPRMASSVTAAFATVGRGIEGAVASMTDAMANSAKPDEDSHVQRIKVS